ncbi:MAG: cellulase family glycosylhydrolase [Bacteroidetes bacterium]|nr:cellulase family glycosylhydrolase [Bacteroidota bacterium]
MKSFILTVLLLASGSSAAQEPPFHRGVNLTGWFQWVTPQTISFGKYNRHTFEEIKSLGADVIRLPIDLQMMLGPGPGYEPDSTFLFFLDQVIHWSDSLDLYLIVDNHTFDPSIPTPPTVINWMKPAWKSIATRYKGSWPKVVFEILNEPHAISASTWNLIQNDVLSAIRAIDSDRWIIAGPVDFNSYNQLSTLPVFTDPKVIVTFHFYDPFLLTHQGANWTDPSLEHLGGLPYPYDAGRMPVLPDVYKGTWIESSFNNYKNEGKDSWVQEKLEIPASYRRTKNQILYCGEFGILNHFSTTDDRARWYETVRKQLEADSIAWTIWDYQGGFGLFVPGSAERFHHDLNLPLVEALGFTAPPQTAWIQRPDTLPVSIYSDFLHHGLDNTSWSPTGTVSLHTRNTGGTGMHAIEMKNLPQYGTFGFRFAGNRDFSRLRTGGYYLKMKIKGTAGVNQLEVRFIDTKTGTGDHPWRNRVILQAPTVNWGTDWKTVKIPLSSFQESGSWDENAWHDPKGLFDWKSIDKLEIVAEQKAMTGETIWLDDIEITDGIHTHTEESPDRPTGFRIDTIWPNPFNPEVHIGLSGVNSGEAISAAIYSVTGQKIVTLNVTGSMIRWNGKNEQGVSCSSGIYFIHVEHQNLVRTGKLVFLR